MRSISYFMVVACMLFVLQGNGQQRDSATTDTLQLRQAVQQDTTIKRKKSQDTTRVFVPVASDDPPISIDTAVLPDTTTIDSLSQPGNFLLTDGGKHLDSLSVTARVLRKNKWINITAPPVFFVSNEKSMSGKESFFYVMCGLLLLLGLFKAFYNQYFSNIFRVYFNTSLRQSQLSEQLLQARLPSFLMNIYFVIVAGIFVWLLFSHRAGTIVQRPLLLLQICIAGVACIYIIKFCFLKFIGWVSGISDATDYYIFIIFLVNKILMLLLLPFIIVLAFGIEEWFGIVETLALLCAGVLFISRYLKGYALAGHKLSVRPFHFFLFIAGAEVIPILLIYKLAVDYLIK